jgi:hypothetical protein
MKNNFSSRILTFSVVLTLILSVSACGGKDNNNKTADKKLGKLKVEIPSELKKNPEAVEYIEGMVGVADEYAVLMDNLVDEVGQYVGMDDSELGLKDKLVITAATATYTMNSAEVFVKWAEFESKRVEIYEDLSEDDIQAMEVVLEHLEKRFEQIETKHAKFFEQEVE